MSVEESIIAMFKAMADHDLKDLVQIGDENEGGVAFRITALGWVAMAKMLREDGHDFEVCACELCQKTRRFLGTICYFRCHLCSDHAEAPYIKAGDMLHCRRCHEIGCVPSGRRIAAGPT